MANIINICGLNPVEEKKSEWERKPRRGLRRKYGKRRGRNLSAHGRKRHLRQYEEQVADGYHWTPEEDEIILKARLEGKTYREITNIFNGMHGDVNGCYHEWYLRNKPDSARFLSPIVRLNRLLRWEEVWGDRKPLPKRTKKLIEKLRANKDGISKKLRNRGADALRKYWRERKVAKLKEPCV